MFAEAEPALPVAAVAVPWADWAELVAASARGFAVPPAVWSGQSERPEVCPKLPGEFPQEPREPTSSNSYVSSPRFDAAGAVCGWSIAIQKTPRSKRPVTL